MAPVRRGVPPPNVLARLARDERRVRPLKTSDTSRGRWVKGKRGGGKLIPNFLGASLN